MISLSPTVTPLLDVLQLRCGIVIEVFDAALRPLQTDLTRGLAGTLDPLTRERYSSVVRSGEARIDRNSVPPTAIYPLWRNREVIGLAVISRKMGVAASLSASEDFRHLEATGQIVRAVLESDLATATQMDKAGQRTRRLQGILRFISQLDAREGEAEMMQAVVQAATVWFDLDCRIYSRERDGSYALFSALPGLDKSKLEPRLDPSLVRDMVSRRRLTAGFDLEHMGFSAGNGEVLVFPIGAEPRWIILLFGVLDPDVEPTFGALAHLIGGELQQAASRRVLQWHERLTSAARFGDTTPESLLGDLLQQLVTACGAAAGRLLLVESGGERALASINAPAPATTGAGDNGDGQHHVERVHAGADAHVQLDLWSPSRGFGFSALAAIDAWLQVLTPWFFGALPVLIGRGTPRQQAEEAAGSEFERRIEEEIERAKRFNLNLALVVIEVVSLAGRPQADVGTVIETVRARLRGSDLIGRVRGGMLAALLVHTGPDGAASATDRLERSLSAVVHGSGAPGVKVGRAVFSERCATAEALVREALYRRRTPDYP